MLQTPPPAHPEIADKAGETSGPYSISELSAAFGVTARTLRHYESEGILSPRREGQKRLYSRRDRGRLKLALQGRRVGFSLSEIREMLDLYDLRDGQEAQLQFSLLKFRERIAQLVEQRQHIDTAIAELTKTCEIVEGMMGGRAAAATDEQSGGTE